MNILFSSDLALGAWEQYYICVDSCSNISLFYFDDNGDNLDQQQKEYAELIHHYHYPAAKIGFFRLFLVPRQD